MMWSLLMWSVVTLPMAACINTKSNMIYYKKGDNCWGAPGIPGNPGYPGNNGINGRPGEKGQKGDRGDMGPQGLQGFQGPYGPEGKKGEKGRRGKKGVNGVKGETGVTGNTGHKGEIGLKGQKGQPAVLPPHVAFSASRTARLGPINEDTIITFDQVFINKGESFDVYSSHFICRINGTYLFTAHVLSNVDYDAYAWIMINGKHIVPLHGDHRSVYGTGSNTLIYHLVYDDHVWVQLMKNSSLLNDFSTFSGYLIFRD